MERLDDTELGRRVEELRGLQQPLCQLCPRRCGADRTHTTGFCGQPVDLQVAAACAHRGEEPPLTGDRGAGTIFVAGCTMRCCFCQNHQISQPEQLVPSWRCSPEQVASRFLQLERDGCHNIEWVSPTQHLPQLVEALRLARRLGLSVPVVYNCNGYQQPSVLTLLDGVVDIYLPDAKYGDNRLARHLSETPDYVELNRRALLEMKRQVGDLRLDADGVARRGLLVRHLVLPGQLDNTLSVLSWIADQLGPDTWVSLMSQYYPAHRVRREGPEARRAPERSDQCHRATLRRPLTAREYRRAISALEAVGLENGWVQERSSKTVLRPDFEQGDRAFEARR